MNTINFETPPKSYDFIEEVEKSSLKVVDVVVVVVVMVVVVVVALPGTYS